MKPEPYKRPVTTWYQKLACWVALYVAHRWLEKLAYRHAVLPDGRRYMDIRFSWGYRLFQAVACLPFNLDPNYGVLVMCGGDLGLDDRYAHSLD